MKLLIVILVVLVGFILALIAYNGQQSNPVICSEEPKNCCSNPHVISCTWYGESTTPQHGIFTGKPECPVGFGLLVTDFTDGTGMIRCVRDKHEKICATPEPADLHQHN